MRYKGEKGKAWEAVKRSVRRRYKDCYTCPAKNLQGMNAHAGHYQPVALAGSNSHLAWDSRFIRLQCGHCNGAGQGMQVIFRRNLVKEYGEEVIKEYDWRIAAHTVSAVKDWKAVISEFDRI